MNVFCLGADQIDSLWPEYGHFLEKYEATRGVDYAGQLREDLRLARKQLWGVQHDGRVRCVVVTRIVDQPRGEICEVYAMAAKGEDDAPFNESNVLLVLGQIEEWARGLGCTRMKIEGRKGWRRLLHDYAEAGVVLEKEI